MARCSQGTRDTLPFLVSNEPSRNLYSGLPVDVQPADASLRLALCFLPSSSASFLSFFLSSILLYLFFFFFSFTSNYLSERFVHCFLFLSSSFLFFGLFLLCSRDEKRRSISSTIWPLFVLSGGKFSNGLKDGERQRRVGSVSDLRIGADVSLSTRAILITFIPLGRICSWHN